MKLILHPCSTSCRPSCGQLLLLTRDTGGQISIGCQCRSGPWAVTTALMRELDREATIALMRAQPSRPSSCSV